MDMTTSIIKREKLTNKMISQTNISKYRLNMQLIFDILSRNYRDAWLITISK